MKKLRFVYLEKISGRRISVFDDVIKDKRLCKWLWIEFILNPNISVMSVRHFKNKIIKKELKKAMSWYFAFRWFLERNPYFEELKEKKILKPYSVKGKVYRSDRRNFLKGIIYGGLC